MIISRSKFEVYDSLLVASRSIKDAKIPSFINFIGSYAFSGCKQLKTVEFTENSKTFNIGPCAFSFSSIKGLILPKNIHLFEYDSLSDMKELRCIEFLSDYLIVDYKMLLSNDQLEIISFPNAHEITIRNNKNSNDHNITIFIVAGAKINLF